jgi:hypothetical protein
MQDWPVAFDHALASLNRNGRFAELYLRWFPNGLYLTGGLAGARRRRISERQEQVTIPAAPGGRRAIP